MFLIDFPQGDFKIGVTTKPDIPENTGFCDFEEGFGYYTKGVTRNGSPDSGFSFKLPFLRDDESNTQAQISEYLA